MADPAPDTNHPAIRKAELRNRLKNDPVFLEGLVSPLVDAVQALLAANKVTGVNIAEFLDVLAIEDAADGMFSTDATNLRFLNRFGGLVSTKAAELTGKSGKDGQIFRTWGDVIYSSKQLKVIHGGDAQAISDLVAKVRMTVLTNIVQYQKTYRQCTRQEIRVDVFATKTELKITDGKATTVMKFELLKPEPMMQQSQVESVMADFTEHFRAFKDYLDFICAARFAPDRRKAFMWLHCPPGWGKTFLMSALKELGLVAEISVKEVEAAGEGKPVGLNADTLSRSWVLATDEARYVKSELKQLNNEITFSPKFEQQVTVPLYMKLFMSAEGIDSLAGSEGVEKQFAERFSYMAGRGVLEHRELFQQLGGGAYHDCLKQGIAGHLNAYVERMRRLGRAEAERESGRLLSKLHGAYRIDRALGCLEDSIEDYANELKLLLVAIGTWKLQPLNYQMPDCMSALTKDLQSKLKTSVVVGYTGTGVRKKVVCLKKPMAFVKAWINWRVDRSEAGKLVYKARDIVDQASEFEIDKPIHLYKTQTDVHRDRVKGLVCSMEAPVLTFV